MTKFEIEFEKWRESGNEGRTQEDYIAWMAKVSLEAKKLKEIDDKNKEIIKDSFDTGYKWKNSNYKMSYSFSEPVFWNEKLKTEEIAKINQKIIELEAEKIEISKKVDGELCREGRKSISFQFIK